MRIDFFWGFVAGDNENRVFELDRGTSFERVLVRAVAHLVDLESCQVGSSVLVKKNELGTRVD